MATHHGSSGQPLDRDIDVTSKAHKTEDTDIEDIHGVQPCGNRSF